jgi:PAS domain S-box-containing protein
MAVIVGLLISIGCPAAYYVIQSSAMGRTAAAYAEDLAASLSDAPLGPDDPRFARFIRFKRDVTSARVLDGNGRAVSGQDYQRPDRSHWSNRNAPTGVAVVELDGREVATVEVTVSRTRLLHMTLLLAAFWTVTGVTLAAVVYLFPVRIARRMQGRIQNLVDRLWRLLDAEQEAREAFASSETRYRELFENTIDVVYLHDVTGRILAINEAGVQASGYDREALLGMDIARLLVCPAAESAGATPWQVTDESPSATFTAELQRQDGTRALVECNARRLVTDAEPAAILGVARDITARRRLEERQVVLAGIVKDLAADSELERLFPAIGERICQLLGTDRAVLTLVEGEELVFRDCYGFHVPPRAPERTRCDETVCPVVHSRMPWSSADLTLEPYWRDSPMVAELGYRAILEVPVLLRGDVIAILAVLQKSHRTFSTEDVGLLISLADHMAVALDRSHLVRELGARLRETQTLLTVGQEVSGTLDVTEAMRRVARETGRALGADMSGAYFVDAERRYLRPIAGYRVPTELIADLLQHPIRLDDDRFLEAAWKTGKPVWTADVLSSGMHRETYERFPHCSNLFFPMIVKGEIIGGFFAVWWGEKHHATPEELRLVEGIANQAALGVENARLFASTQAQATALREKNAELDSFVYSVSHDLKAPLVVIQGMSSIVLEDNLDKLDEDNVHYLRRIQSNAQQMERLIMDLLAISRVGREARPPESVPLAEIVDAVTEELAEPIRAAGIKVINRGAVTLWAIRTQIEQVVGNLLINAVKYIGTPPAPTIEVGAVDHGKYVECSVADNGIGIDPAYHGTVFEMFQRLKDVEAEGTGVGLAIVKKIVEAGGGRIWVESSKGQGATFRFTWPNGPGGA